MLAGLLASDDDGAPVEHWYSLTATPGGAGTFDVSRDDEPLARSSCDALTMSDLGEACALVLALVVDTER